MRGFARVAAAVPPGFVADVERNVDSTILLWQRAHEEDCALVVFPELGLSGYTVRDLFHDRHLLDGVRAGLHRLVEASRELAPLAIVGAPLLRHDALYNAAVAIQGGRVLGAVPKCYLPNYREFEEHRWFRAGHELAPGSTCTIAGEEVPFGTDVLFVGSPMVDLVVGVELCEDLWVHVPPSVYAISAGATVICNLSASNFTVGKAELRRLLGRSASDRGKCAYLYTAAGPGESSTDLAFDADAFVCENGHELASSQRFSREPQLVSVDVDIELLVRERYTTTTFAECSRAHRKPHRRVDFAAPLAITPPLRRTIERHPFVPHDPHTLGQRCWEIFEIQTNALATRMRAIGRPKLVLGISGGLDSTHAALVCAGALQLLGQPSTDLCCVTMPGFGTSAGTRDNAEQLVRALGGELSVAPISEASRHVLALVGHPAATGTDSAEELLARVRELPDLGDVALENVQARLRTLVLMTVANRVGGLVVGTGDLSEKALGWSTYSGDHISMYDVNAGVPKTLIQFVIRWVANERAASWSSTQTEQLRTTLFAILDTPISPELLPTDAAGAIAQLTETTLGPYELHDFFLYHLVRHGERPTRILELARIGFAGAYDDAALVRWLRVFLQRFFANQFKRSCTADGPKVGQVALSPRGDWRMPSDARVRTWLAEVDAWGAGARTDAPNR
ncbi:MAG: NAD(+) synthase [Deltaproteobacteria bacterium]|nr:NAD(+) synthase [Nannocystaceae bacterium]